MAAPLPTATVAGPWVVDFNEHHCIASRQFKVGDEEYVLALQPYPTKDDTALYLQVPHALDGFDGETARILVGDKRIKESTLFGEPVVQKGHSKYRSSLTSTEYAEISGASSLTIDSKVARAVFPISQMPDVKKTLDLCVSQLLESWGLSRDAQARLAVFPKPIGDERSFFSSSDYPQSAVTSGAIGDIEAILNIDDTGKAVGCRLNQESGHKDLDQTTCAILMRRARYVPAKDRQGNPMAAPVLLTIVWMLPTD